VRPCLTKSKDKKGKEGRKEGEKEGGKGRERGRETEKGRHRERERKRGKGNKRFAVFQRHPLGPPALSRQGLHHHLDLGPLASDL
jgi:hypothetical protein